MGLFNNNDGYKFIYPLPTPDNLQASIHNLTLLAKDTFLPLFHSITTSSRTKNNDSEYTSKSTDLLKCCRKKS